MPRTQLKRLTCHIPADLPAVLGVKAPLRLDHALFQSLEKREGMNRISRSLIRKLIVAGAVYVNGRRVRIASKAMRGGEIIDCYLDEAKLGAAENPERFLPLRVLYSDEAMVCFDKPAGLPTQPTLDEARVNLFHLASKQMNSYLGMHHRLDRDTSGVILFAADKRFNSWFADQFKDHRCTKVYVAVVHGKLSQPRGRLETFLAEVRRQGKQAKYGSVRSGGKKAITEYTVLDQSKEFSLVEVSIMTGRTHQIRVHFSEMGHPILGDSLYGSKQEHYQRYGRYFLHAHALTIEHPVTKNWVRVESPVPKEFRQWFQQK